MRDYSETDFADAAVRHEVVRELRDIERHAQTFERQLRHDVTNAAGAARNAILLMDDRTTALSFGRLVEMARRNARTVAALLATAGNSGAGGNQRNDLGRPGQRDDADAFGL